MLYNCATSCDEVAVADARTAEQLSKIHSFFDLSAKDINGNVIQFEKFKGQVTIVVNVASYCGYTESHYTGLVQLWGHVKDTGRVNILAFPCNQFGSQEPGTNEQIIDFAKGYGVEFTMMDKIDVNGKDASIVYKYLKAQAGPKQINWNFATYFMIAPDGTITSHQGVEPLHLKDSALGLLGDEL